MSVSKKFSSKIKAVDEIVHALDQTIHDTVGPETRACIMHGVEFLEDHLRQLYGLEESRGLLDIIVRIHPELEKEVHRLQCEHDVILAEAHQLVLALENSSAPSAESLQAIMNKLRALIDEILEHEQHEREVVIESVRIDQTAKEE